MLQCRTAALVCALSVVLAGCSIFGDGSTGRPSTGLKTASLAAAYVPLESHELMIVEHWGAGVVVAPHIAVTNAHNFNLIPPDAILAVSKDYDLLFFHTDKAVPVPTTVAHPGQAIIAYGQGSKEDLREAEGAIRAVDVRVAARCSQCREQKAITYDADAGPGFSGGPLVDAKTGTVVGLTFGYRDREGLNGARLMFAYSIETVVAEMHRLLGPEGPKS
jgi:hypothetical protein